MITFPRFSIDSSNGRSYPTIGNHPPTTYSVSFALPPNVVVFPLWWSWSGSNRRPPACKAGALPTELQPLKGSFGNAEGNRTPVRNPYMNKTFLRNRRLFSDALQRALAMPSESCPGRTGLYASTTLFFVSGTRKTVCAVYLRPQTLTHPRCVVLDIQPPIRRRPSLPRRRRKRGGS